MSLTRRGPVTRHHEVASPAAMRQTIHRGRLGPMRQWRNRLQKGPLSGTSKPGRGLEPLTPSLPSRPIRRPERALKIGICRVFLPSIVSETSALIGTGLTAICGVCSGVRALGPASASTLWASVVRQASCRCAGLTGAWPRRVRLFQSDGPAHLVGAGDQRPGEACGNEAPRATRPSKRWSPIRARGRDRDAPGAAADVELPPTAEQVAVGNSRRTMRVHGHAH